MQKVEIEYIVIHMWLNSQGSYVQLLANDLSPQGG